MTDVVMPQLGETVTEGTITKWFKQVGDNVAEDDILFEVSTDKVDSEVPSPVSGVLSEILVAEGDTVDVGTVLARMGGADEAPATAAPAAEPAAPAAPEPVESAGAESAAPAPPEPAPPEPAPPEPAAPVPPEPAAPEPAAPVPPEPAPAAPAPPEPAPAPVSADAAPAGDGRLLSPVVRRLLADHELDAAAIVGTGLGGRITRADVEQAIQARGPAPAATAAAAPVAAPAPAAAPTPAAAPPPAAPAASAPEAPVGTTVPAPATATAAAASPPSPAGDHVVALSNIRRRTGDHMVMSKATSPHVLTAIEVDFEGVERVRSAHKAEWKSEEGFSLTYLPFIVRAVADAIADFPHMNASLGDGELVVHGSINMAIAVDLDFQGLLAPVVRAAETKRLRAISRDIVDLATRARSKKLGADEISGGTFTITNPGQYGTMMQFPIINQPQVAILSTDGISRKPVVISDADGNEAIAVHSVGVLALAWDHRAFDGAYVAAFLHRLRSIIETRDWEAEI